MKEIWELICKKTIAYEQRNFLGETILEYKLQKPITIKTLMPSSLPFNHGLDKSISQNQKKYKIEK